MSRILVFPGNFDPICAHHMSVVSEVMMLANKGEIGNGHWKPAHLQTTYVPFDAAWILPYNKEPFGLRELAPIADRIEMIELAIKDCDMGDYIQVSDFEEFFNIKCGRTKALLRFAKFYKQNDLVFLLGKDEAVNLRLWRNSRKLTRNLSFITVSRRDFSRGLKPDNKKSYYYRRMSDWYAFGYNSNHKYISQNIAGNNMFGKSIREHLSAGGDRRRQMMHDPVVLTESVSDYIKEHKLYINGDEPNEQAVS